MKTKLTKRLLGFLIKRGYKYCLSSTYFNDSDIAPVAITLKPVIKHPLLQKLPSPYNTYLNLLDGFWTLLFANPDREVFVELSEADFKRYHTLYPTFENLTLTKNLC
jgi:hypothetical protein